MRRNIECVSTLTSLILVLCSSSSAQTVVVPHTDRGWYTETGQHIPPNQNYIVGDIRGEGCSVDCPAKDYRNFFVFDLSSIVLPIESAKLALYVPIAPLVDGYDSGDPSENYELHDVITSIDSLLDGTGGVAAHTDLGSGVVYGSRTMTAADMGSMIEITLNA